MAPYGSINIFVYTVHFWVSINDPTPVFGIYDDGD